MPAKDRRSRYAGSRRLTVVDATGDEHVLLAPRTAAQARLNGSYEIADGDRLDLLAHAALGDSTQWWVLADANPWADATELERPGTIIRLPDE